MSSWLNDRSQQKSQIAFNREGIDFARDEAERARRDIYSLFGPMRQAARGGFESSLDYARRSEPRRIDAMQTGSSAARQASLAGLGQIQNAILGKPIDLSALQSFGEKLQFQEPVESQMPAQPELPAGMGLPEPGAPATAVTDWRTYITAPGNEDLYRAFMSQDWTRDPEEWATKMWMNTSSAGVDPRLQNFGGGR